MIRKKNFQKQTKTWLVFTILFLLLLLFGFRVYQSRFASEKVKEETFTWKVYQNEEFKFQMKYPPDWVLNVERSGDLKKAEAVQLKWETKSDLEFSLGIDPRPLRLVLSHLLFEKEKMIGENKFYLQPIKRRRLSDKSDYSYWFYYTGGEDKTTPVFSIGFPTEQEKSWVEEIEKILATVEFLSEATFKNIPLEGEYYVYQHFNPPGEIEKILLDRSPSTGPNAFWQAGFEKEKDTFQLEYSHYVPYPDGEGQCAFNPQEFKNISRFLNQSFSVESETGNFEGQFFKSPYPAGPNYTLTLFYSQGFQIKFAPRYRSRWAGDKDNWHLYLGERSPEGKDQIAIVNKTLFSQNISKLISSGSKCLQELAKR